MFRHVRDEFFDYLKTLRFTGEVWAIPEGTPVFAEESLVRITAPIIEAQIVETFLLTTLTFQTMIATKAAHAAYIGGCIGTSNVEAGFRFGIPTYGTVAHSFVMAYGDEEESFRQFQRVFPNHAVLLVDTYDTLAAVDKIIQLGLRPKGVRLDSGDLVELSQEVQRRLNRAGCSDTKIFASGDLNEFVISELRVEETAPPIHSQGSDNVWKEGKLENGVEILVPPFIAPGELIRVGVETGTYVVRAKPGKKK